MTEGEPTSKQTPSESADVEDVTFSLTGVRDGFISGLPLAIGVAGYGVVFGVVAGGNGLSVAEATLMSATVLAGAAQLLVAQLWTDPIPVVAILTTTLVVNLRYLLMGAALRPWFRHLSPSAAYGSIFFTADENWALTISELRSGNTRGAFLLGSGIAIWIFWIGATIVGVTAGEFLGPPEQYGLDFVVTAVFLTLAVSLWEGRESIQPWLVAAGSALVASRIAPGEWYILAGALAGAAFEVVRYDE